MYKGSSCSTSPPTLVTFLKKKKLAILVGVKWYLLVLICISLMANGIDPILIYFLVISVSSLEEYLFKSPFIDKEIWAASKFHLLDWKKFRTLIYQVLAWQRPRKWLGLLEETGVKWGMN